MKSSDIIILVSACVALAASLLPIAGKSGLYVNISHIGGLTILLYVLPAIIIVASVMSLYRKINDPRPWYLSVGIIGFIISILAVISGINQLKAFEQFGGAMLEMFMKEMTGSEVSQAISIGLGGVLLLSSYLVIVILGLLYKPLQISSRESK